MLLISFRSGHCFLHFRMREWLSGGASPSQGEGRGFESRLALIFTKLPDGLPESFFIKGKKNMDVFIWILDVVGTIAFSISGAMVGIRKKMDLFGVCVLGVVTATGGGMTRDIVLGINPAMGSAACTSASFSRISSMFQGFTVGTPQPWFFFRASAAASMT